MVYTSTPHPSPEAQASQLLSWPTVFVVPKLTYEAEFELHLQNAEFETTGTYFQPGLKLKGVILDGLAQEMIKFTKYPKDYQCEEVAAALTRAHPCLGQLGSKIGFGGWKQSLKYKMQNYRTKLGRLGHPEILVNSLKHKKTGQGKAAANIKKPRKAEVNYIPLHPKGETTESLENERIALLSELKKRDNEVVIKAKMEKTFSHRRLEIVEQRPLIGDFKCRWPALFQQSEVNAEFLRITTSPLQSKFMWQLDHFSDKLLKIFKIKGGLKGHKIKEARAISDLFENIHIKRGCILRSIAIYLNEDPDSFFKEYQASASEDAKRDMANTVMGIYTLQRDVDGQPEDVGIVIEGNIVMDNLGSVIVGDALTAAKTAYLSTIFTDPSNNPRTLFSTVNKLLKPRADTLPSSTSTLCSSFLQFFSDKITAINLSLSTASDTHTSPPASSATISPPISLDLPILPPHGRLSQFTLVTHPEIVKLISSSKPTTCSLDPLPTPLLKSCLY
ncbi:uncharacterized protein LOC117561933 [Gymnodraco acuticeps]|uniref:Uncharacterized protein LOC117561933 n=1 Tax=Gymnodraco acuticeps TaxID=8218 RepID=A0A6P8VWR0_GYMAC|nr:uncharacterized protein LOC117561933 [Gymnodraco acuticeps]